MDMTQIATTANTTMGVIHGNAGEGEAERAAAVNLSLQSRDGVILYAATLAM